MNGFKIYQDYKGEKINFKILFKEGDENLILEFVLSYPNVDIWGDNICDNFSNGQMYYKKIYLHRDKWTGIKGCPNVSTAINDFNSAIDEFKNVDDWCNFKNEVNVYLANEAEKIINELDKK